MEEFELITLKSGVKSLRSRANRETFHPVTGPRIEANLLHVTQQRLVERSSQKRNAPFVVWDVGLGAAANAVAAIEALKTSAGQVEIHSFDRTTLPLEFALSQANELSYLLGYERRVRELLDRSITRVTEHLSWRYHAGDFARTLLDSTLPAPDAILYDPYSPTTNVDMWTLDHFTALSARLDPAVPCLLTNYTCSTAVRATLLLAGFYVGVGWGVGEKVETTIAANRPQLLDRPLDLTWLKRVRVSHSAAPLRQAPRTIAPITDADFARISALPQFGMG